MKSFLVEWLKGYLYYLVFATLICVVAFGMTPSWMVWGGVAALGLAMTAGSSYAKVRGYQPRQPKVEPGELPPKHSPE